MLTVKQNIKKSPELQRLHEKSRRRRYRKQEKRKSFCEKSVEMREIALKKEYPLVQIEKGRKRFPLLLFLIRCRLVLCGIKIFPLNSFARKNISGPVIFVPTHIGKFDIEVVYSCIKTHALLLAGSQDRLLGSLDGWFLEKNGVNYVDRADKKDRANAVKKMQRDLEHGFDLLWFIEGTWNLSANQLVYDASYAVIKMALEYGVAIIPIGLNQVEKDIYIKFGTPFYPDSCKKLEDSIQDLRDALATLKWDIFEYVKETRKDGFITRTTLDENYWSDYLIKRFREWPKTDLLEEMEYVFRPKGVYSAEEVFAPIRALEVKRENAFLWRKQ